MKRRKTPDGLNKIGEILFRVWAQLSPHRFEVSLSLHFGSFLFLFTHQESYVLSRVHIPQGILLTIGSSVLRSSPFDSGTIDIFNAFWVGPL